MPNYVRVRDTSGAEYSVVDSAVEPYMTVLDEPGGDANGDPLPDRPAPPKADKPAAEPKTGKATTTSSKEKS